MPVMFVALLVSVLAVVDQKEKLVDHPAIIEMHKIANEKRSQCKQCKRPPLELDEECCQVAQEWANYMAENRKFHHGKKEQIIAYGYRDANAAFRGWMNSRGHRRWMLSNSKKCGWGCQKSAKGTWYWVGVFR